MKALLTFSLTAWLGLSALGQGNFSAVLVVRAAPTTNSVPAPNFGRTCVITRVCGTNSTTWTNFTGSLSLTPYGNLGVEIIAQYPWWVERETNDWVWAQIEITANCSGTNVTKVEPLYMTKHSVLFGQSYWWYPSSMCLTPPTGVVGSDPAFQGYEEFFPTHPFWTLDDLIKHATPDKGTPIFTKGVSEEGKGYLGLPGGAFATYEIQSSTNLSTTNWVTVTNITTGADGALNYEWPIATNIPANYYRIRLQY